MNRSGVVMPWLLRRCGVDRRSLLIVTDNLDLPAGTVRLKRGGSNLSHRGIASVVDALQNQDFLRLYVGIGRPSNGESVVEHVLGRPEGKDADAITAAIGRAVEAVEALLQQQPEEVMNGLNRRR
jgi:PTH1 family peptidyl-tRNA hydrolase